MGEYYIIANPNKQQYLDPDTFGWNIKLHCMLHDDIAALVGCLIAECSQSERDILGPLAGAWAGDPVILAGDYAKSDTQRNLYQQAEHEYELLRIVTDDQPKPNGDDYIVVNLHKRQFIDAQTWPRGVGTKARLGGWMGAILGQLICISGGAGIGTWAGDPIVLTTSDALTNPNSVVTSTTHKPERNLYEMARAEFEDITVNCLRELELVDQEKFPADEV